LALDIEPLLTKVRQGDDLTPHLSLQPRTRGFTPGASGTGPGVDRWADKDILLNVMGYHHLHFDALLHNQIRSDDVLFAHITRDTFTAVGVFDHTVFEPPDPARPMTKERNRLWKIFSERTTRGAPVGATVLQSMIATSGHPVQLVQDSAQYAGTIARIDPQLDDANYVQGLYRQAGLPAPTKPKLRWHMKFLDLGLLDEAMGAFFVLKKGRT
jgi:hypothetical protein